jgi:NADH-quinone oxidoreductase subunit J
MSALFDWIADNRGQLVPPVFGFIALYLLLPRGNRAWRSVGIAFGVVALATLGFLYGSPGSTLNSYLFYLFGALAIIGAAATVTFPNPIYSALSFAVVVLNVAGLFVLRGAMFLAATTVIIYAGAIVVTFLFIIMLSRHPGNAPYDRIAREPFLASLAAFLLLSALLFTLVDWRQNPVVATSSAKDLAAKAVLDLEEPTPPGVIPLHGKNPYPESRVRKDEPSRLRGLGRTLFSDYLFAVELAGTLLLVAGVGAVAIAPRRARARPPAS